MKQTLVMSFPLEATCVPAASNTFALIRSSVMWHSHCFCMLIFESSCFLSQCLLHTAIFHNLSRHKTASHTARYPPSPCCFPLPLVDELVPKSGGWAQQWGWLPASPASWQYSQCICHEHGIFSEGELFPRPGRNLPSTSAIAKLGTNETSSSWVKRKGSGEKYRWIWGGAEGKANYGNYILVCVYTHMYISQRKWDLCNWWS